MITMKISLGLENYEHLKEKSYYNHNYYKLQSYGDWCFLNDDILLEECNEDDDYSTFSLGHFDENGKFVSSISWNSGYGEGVGDLMS